MRNIFQITKDMRDLAKMQTDLADELDQIFAVFTGSVPAVPFVQGKSSSPLKEPELPKSRKKSVSNPNKGIHATNQQKLLIRQLWFSLPVSEQTLEKKREISRRVGISVQIAATIIRKTQSADLTNFLKQQAPSGSGARIT
jgi:hypothetical protein